MSIKIRISATAAGVKSTFNSLKNQAKRTGTAIKSAFSGIGSKIAGVIGIAAVSAAIKSATSRLDDLAKSAANLNMDSDEFQKFSHAANLAGSSAKEFEVGTVNMFRTLGSALDGAEGDIKKFQRLGIDPEQLRGKESAEQLGMIYDALNAIEDPTKKVAVAMELFGRSGRRIAGLAANWRELKKEAEGKLISKEDLAVAEAYNDAIANLQLTFAKVVIESELVQYLTKVVLLMDRIYSKTPGLDNAIIARNMKPADLESIAKNAILQERRQKYKKSLEGRVESAFEDHTFLRVARGFLEWSTIVGRFFGMGRLAWNMFRGNTDERILKGITEEDTDKWLKEKFGENWRAEGEKRKKDFEKSQVNAIMSRLGVLSDSERAQIEEAAGNLEKLLELEKKFNKERRAAANITYAKNRSIEEIGATDAEKELLNRAETVQDVYKIKKQILEARAEQEKIAAGDKSVQDTIADYQQEFKWQQMTLKGLEKQVAIEKALAAARKRAKRELTEAETEALSKSAGAVFDINKKMSTDSTVKMINTPDFKGDSVLSMGGMIGSQAQFSRSRDELLRKQFRVQQELYNRVNELNNKMPNRYENQGARF